jgi:hypothetical protein
LPRDQTGDVSNISGEVVVGEPLVEYSARIVETFVACPYSPDEIIAAYRQRCAMRLPPPAPRPASFVRRSLRSFA